MKAAINQIKNKALPILKEGRISKASLFGSIVRGEDTDKSDIDMLVEIPRGTGLFAFVGLKHKLEDVLHKKVDLVTYNSVHPLLRNIVFKEQIRIL